jgi:hypothetical protein
MGVQTRTDLTNQPFRLEGTGKSINAVLLQDAGRGTTALERNTLMAQIAASGKWVPFSDETATDGSQFPRGIIEATVTGAELVAGDVEDIPILVGDITVDQNQLVIENSKTLATVINVPANINTRVDSFLRSVGIYLQDTIDADGFEN